MLSGISSSATNDSREIRVTDELNMTDKLKLEWSLLQDSVPIRLSFSLVGSNSNRNCGRIDYRSYRLGHWNLSIPDSTGNPFGENRDCLTRVKRGQTHGITSQCFGAPISLYV